MGWKIKELRSPIPLTPKFVLIMENIFICMTKCLLICPKFSPFTCIFVVLRGSTPHCWQELWIGNCVCFIFLPSYLWSGSKTCYCYIKFQRSQKPVFLFRMLCFLRWQFLLKVFIKCIGFEPHLRCVVGWCSLCELYILSLWFCHILKISLVEGAIR